MTEADLDVFAKARAAYLDDPANATAPEYEMMKSLSEPYALRTKAVENGMNYQFAFTICVVTIYKSDGDEVGKVIEIQGASGYGTPGLPPYPKKRDTLIDSSPGKGNQISDGFPCVNYGILRAEQTYISS